MKKIVLTLILCFLTVFTMVGCSNKKNQKSDLENVQSSKVLRVGLECNYKPFNWTQTDDSNGGILIHGQKNLYGNGYDVMVAKYLAQTLNVDVELYVTEWDGLIESLKSGIIDCVIAGMSPTDERKKEIDFTNEYYNSNLVIVCKIGSDISTKTTLTEIDDSKYKVAAQLNTFHLNALHAQTSNVNIVESADFSQMQVSLEMGAIDGYVAELPTALTVSLDDTYTYVALENNTTGFTATASDTAVAVGLRKGSNLLSPLNDALSKLSADTRALYMQNAINYQVNAIGD